MSSKITTKNLVKNLIFLLALIGLTFYYLLKDNNITEIFTTIKSVNIFFVAIAILCVFIYMCGEAFNIKRVLSLLGNTVSFWSALKYAFIGFFFSSVTPGASGGQPMQIYYMNKDKISISHSSLSILMELAAFQLVSITIAIISFISNYNFIVTTQKFIKVLIIVGISFNLLMLLFITCSIFSSKLTIKFMNLCFKLISKIKFLNLDKIQSKFEEQILEYNKGAKFIKSSPIVIIKNILTTFIQISAMYSVPFFVYKSFGFSGFSFFEIYTLQSILSIAVSAIPLPGAVGVSESGFLLLFRTFFPAAVLNSAMLLNRGISFYLYILISGIVVIFAHIISTKKNKILSGKNNV